MRSGGDISLSTNNPAPGQSVDLAAVVRNTGGLAASNVPVAFFDGNPAGGGVLIGSTQPVAGVFPPRQQRERASDVGRAADDDEPDDLCRG